MRHPQRFEIVYTEMGLDPPLQPCRERDKIVWKNSARQPCTLTLPTCAKPSDGQVIIAPGDSTIPYTVNGRKRPYDYFCQTPDLVCQTPGLGVSSGTIDVES